MAGGQEQDVVKVPSNIKTKIFVVYLRGNKCEEFDLFRDQKPLWQGVHRSDDFTPFSNTLIQLKVMCEQIYKTLVEFSGRRL